METHEKTNVDDCHFENYISQLHNSYVSFSGLEFFLRPPSWYFAIEPRAIKPRFRAAFNILLNQCIEVNALTFFVFKRLFNKRNRKHFLPVFYRVYRNTQGTREKLTNYVVCIIVCGVRVSPAFPSSFYNSIGTQKIVVYFLNLNYTQSIRLTALTKTTRCNLKKRPVIEANHCRKWQ